MFLQLFMNRRAQAKTRCNLLKLENRVKIGNSALAVLTVKTTRISGVSMLDRFIFEIGHCLSFLLKNGGPLNHDSFLDK